ncbi:glycosyltransferase [Citrobacter youngae]|uniref:glycosyltransferase n=1 Tax=Citrobacter youngae TaxID=133448 RepID=UPI000E16B725|nr:glycosyltransferase [Citrobacter youngae]SUY02456.1 lipopolysaccharide 1,2-N-acetylglucosaminetransferase [Citrobacter youngae]
MKNYGIYICYPPTVPLHKEGLGRYLAAFIKGAESLKDARFIILCPSWSRNDIIKLFESEGVSLDKVKICAPEGLPIILKIYMKLLDYKKSRKRKQARVFDRALKYISTFPARRMKSIEKRLAQSYSIISLLPLLLDVLFVFLFSLISLPCLFVLSLLYIVKKKIISHRVRRYASLFRGKVSKIFNAPKNEGFVSRLYGLMQQVETERMHNLISKIESVQAWYAPTSFWPSFTKIDAPRLMCVPDVVLNRFPVGFSAVGGERFLETFNQVTQTINGNDKFVTYSMDVKQKTLMKYFNVPDGDIYVIKHAPNKLDNWIDISDVSNKQEYIVNYARRLFSIALSKQKSEYYHGLSGDFQFIFYASQARPNKNIISLLRAYNYLLKDKFLQHKLILTCSLEKSEEIRKFVKRNNLQNDVLFMSGLSVQELAACYKLADLAVNPSLSEGGCPFTFTEALSVQTPVVMGRIGVTEEVLTDQLLQEMTFFDPYDWKNIATKIEWALNNLDSLREIQLKAYNELTKRTWEDVVCEHIAAMDEIAENFKITKDNTSGK